MDTIIVNGREYVARDSMATLEEEGPYVICRCDRASVFAGYLKSREGREVVLTDARRIWYWAGAASLSELAVRGTSKPEDCKFPVAVPEVLLLDAIEVIPCTEGARESIQSVKAWSE